MILQPKPSRWLLRLHLTNHGGAVICLCWVAFPIWVKIIGSILLCLSLFYQQSKTPRISQLVYDNQSHWYLQLDTIALTESPSLPAGLYNNYVVSRFFILLNFKLPQHRFPQTILLFADSESKAKLRRLRFLLT